MMLVVFIYWTQEVKYAGGIKMSQEDDKFMILREIDKKPESSQRDLSKSLGVSLGKVNYVLRELKKKGLIKINNFSKN